MQASVSTAEAGTQLAHDLLVKVQEELDDDVEYPDYWPVADLALNTRDLFKLFLELRLLQKDYILCEVDEEPIYTMVRQAVNAYKKT